MRYAHPFRLFFLLFALQAGGLPAQDGGFDPISGPRLHKEQFLRGDFDADGAVQLTDAILDLGFLFLSGSAPPCLAASDFNGDLGLDISDPVYLLQHLFLGTPPPPQPGPLECGVDPADAPLPCERYDFCPDDTPLIAHVLSRITFGPTEELYRRIQTRADLLAYIEEQLAAPEGYDARVDEPGLFDRIESLGIRHDLAGNPADVLASINASQLIHAIQSRWQLLEVLALFWENHFHTQITALRENFFSRGMRGGGALGANPDFFAAADGNHDAVLTQAEWEAFRALHPGLIAWEDFGRRLILDGTLTLDEYTARNTVAFWKYGSAAEQTGIAAEMERRENDFFRAAALGGFRRMVEGSGKGVPMLIYLNGFENTAASPNENYARELVELHTLGADRTYTQRDIEQLARLLTGWTAGWVDRAPFDPGSDRQYIGHPELENLPLNLREPPPVRAPTQQFWEDDRYTWAFVVDAADHNWDRKDIFLPQYGGVDSIGNTLSASDAVAIPARARLDRSVPAAVEEFETLLDRLVSFRDCRKFICTKLIQLLVTDDLGALAKTAPVPAAVLAMFNGKDLDHDGAIERSEWEEPVPLVLPNGRPPELFDALDLNRDDRLSLEEYREPDLLLAAMQRWEETGGEIRAVVRVILYSDEFLGLKFQKAKVRTPLEQVAFTARILNAPMSNAQLKLTAQDLSLAGMELFNFDDPTGESELGFDWMHTIGLLERMKWIGNAVYPVSAQNRRSDWNAGDFQARYRLETAADAAGFFISLIHPEGLLEEDRALAIDTFNRAAAGKPAALAAFLLSIAPAMQQ